MLSFWYVHLASLPSSTPSPTHLSHFLLQQHPFLVQDRTREVDMVTWVESAMAARDAARKAARAAQALATSGAATIGASINGVAGTDVLIRAG